MRRLSICDIRGLSFEPLHEPFWIVSLVPCWTETLFDLGLTRGEIVGRTHYCIHPRGRVDPVERLGGPKNPALDRVFELSPDLVVMDQEENRREDFESIERHWSPSRVFATGPRTVDSALADVGKLGLMVHRAERAQRLIERVEALRNQLVARHRGTVLYLVWQEPWIAAGPETYIGDVLRILGYENVCDHSSLKGGGRKGERDYPVFRLNQIVHRKPDTIFLSTEPFPFRKSDLTQLRCQIQKIDAEYAHNVDIRLVNGEFFSWYGSRMVPAFRFFVKTRA